MSDPRLNEFRTLDPRQAKAHLMGYPDDEGIRLNTGRPGAALAPDEIRKVFYRLTPGMKASLKPFLYDAGNIDVAASLSERHEVAEKNALQVFEKSLFHVSLGGGHDYGYPDAAAFVKAFSKSKKKPVVINFDAHLDVRPLDKGLTSGTPFYRLYEEVKTPFHFLEVGIQDHCNSSAHFEWLKKKKASVIFENEIQKKGLQRCFLPFLKKWKNHPTFISLDIDVFSSSVAPGCSQSWPVGLDTDSFFQTWPLLFKSLDVKGLGIYEVSPPLDVGVLTSRLAALVLHRTFQLKGYL